MIFFVLYPTKSIELIDNGGGVNETLFNAADHNNLYICLR